jgi:16S rRNA (cytidine1402-2'-O)-methyltransferase
MDEVLEEDRDGEADAIPENPEEPPSLEEPVPTGNRLPPGLYVVGTPIGNLGDITLRALEALKAVHAVLTEDTRHTGILLARYGIRVQMVSCHKFNEASRVDEIVSRIRSGQAVALVTNAGMPAVSDPGSRVVAGCRRAGCLVTVLPGPSAVTAAIAMSGLGFGGGFVFEGFLPRKSGARRRRLEALAVGEMPVVLYESPYRLLALLEEAGTVFGQDRLMFVGRELTKKFEEGRTGTAAELIAAYQGRTVKGELTVVIAPSGGK